MNITDLKPEPSAVKLDTRSELIMLRDVVIRCHELSTGRYVLTPQERLDRIGKLCDAAIEHSPVMGGFLGRIRSWTQDALNGGGIDGPDRVVAP